MQQSTAYNLNDFTARQPRNRPQMYVAPPVRKRRRMMSYSRKAVQVILLSTLFLTLVCGVLYLQTTVTELSAKVEAQQLELVGLQSEYTYLSNELEMKTSLKNVEEYATTRLGLVKLDRSQMVYVQRDPGSTITCKEGLLSRLFGTAALDALSFSSYISPVG